MRKYIDRTITQIRTGAKAFRTGVHSTEWPTSSRIARTNACPKRSVASAQATIRTLSTLYGNAWQAFGSCHPHATQIPPVSKRLAPVSKRLALCIDIPKQLTSRQLKSPWIIVALAQAATTPVGFVLWSRRTAATSMGGWGHGEEVCEAAAKSLTI